MFSKTILDLRLGGREEGDSGAGNYTASVRKQNEPMSSERMAQMAKSKFLLSNISIY